MCFTSLIWSWGSLPSWSNCLLGLMHEVSGFAVDSHGMSCVCGWRFISRQILGWLALSEYQREEFFLFHHTVLIMLLIPPAFWGLSSLLLIVVAEKNFQSLSILIWPMAERSEHSFETNTIPLSPLTRKHLVVRGGSRSVREIQYTSDYHQVS